jgi:dUTP pyrophosphatase
MPKKAHEEDACFDIYASEDCVVPAVGTCPVPTGVKMNIPTNYYVEIRPRSGMAFKHGVEAFMGTIDCSFLDEVKILLKNDSITPYHVKYGDRIAQFKLTKLEPTEIVSVTSFNDAIDRGGGFGSSGR